MAWKLVVEFKYFCAAPGCTLPATKPQVTPSGEKKKGAGLGGWRCAVHGPCKVRREMVKQHD
jgi:hypothetical protein